MAALKNSADSVCSDEASEAAPAAVRESLEVSLTMLLTGTEDWDILSVSLFVWHAARAEITNKAANKAESLFM